jgi:hypothetical protein
MAESSGYPGVIAARFEDDNVPTDLGMDDDSKSLNVNLRTWNTSTLEWERMTSPWVEGEITRSLLEELISQLKIMNLHLSILTREEIT